MKKNNFAYGWLLLAAMCFSIACKENPKDTNKSETNVVSDTSAVTVDTTTATQTLAPSDTLKEKAEKAEPVGGGQGSNYGYLNSLELLSMMPEIKAADRKLETIAKQKEAELGGLMTQYQDKMKYLQENGQNLAPVEQEAKMKELQQLEQSIQEKQLKGQDYLAAEKERLYKPALDKADKAIKKIGQEGGYAFIYDSSVGSLLYADTTKNLLPLVKQRLGIKGK